MPQIPLRRALPAAFVVSTLTGVAGAQCTDPSWLPGGGCPGVNLFAASSIVWDADGPGPGTPKIVVGGRFDVAGDAVANNIAAYDPATGHWEALGSGLGLPGDLSTVHAVAVMPDGSLVAGGDFLDAGGLPASHIARWNGSSWSPLGDGLDPGLFGSVVRALVVLPDGSLVAGGEFMIAGAAYSPRVARWTGEEWVSLGNGAMTADGYAFVSSLVVDTAGDLFAAGFFETMDDVPASNVARWDGKVWSALGLGVNLEVRAATALPKGGIVVGGYLTEAGGAPAMRLAKWDGSNWSAPGGGVDVGAVFALHAVSQDELIVGGTLEQVGGIPVNGIARLTGDTWSAMGSGLIYTGSMPIAFGIVGTSGSPLGGDFIVAGSFDQAGESNASGIARWSDDASPALGWSALGTGFNGAWVAELKVLSDGSVLAGGDFSAAGAGVHHRLARWNGSEWVGAVPADQELQSFGFVEEFAERADGAFLIGGRFMLPGHADESAIALWDGQAWNDLGAACDGYVRAMAWRPNGDLLVTGTYDTIGGLATRSVAIWNGKSWSTTGTGLDRYGTILAAVTMPNGDIVVGGAFYSVDGVFANNIARWDGTTWHPLGDGVDQPVEDLAVAPDGTLVAVGDFFTANGYPVYGVARWDGKSWSPIGEGVSAGIPFAVVVESNGDVVIGGQFTDVSGVPALNIARWNGKQWAPIAGGLAGPTDDTWSIAYTLAIEADGTLDAGGQFLRADGNLSVNFARFGCEATCDADLDGDGSVGPSDLAILLGAWGTQGSADLDQSGTVGASDLAILLGAWGGC